MNSCCWGCRLGLKEVHRHGQKVNYGSKELVVKAATVVFEVWALSGSAGFVDETSWTWNFS